MPLDRPQLRLRGSGGHTGFQASDYCNVAVLTRSVALLVGLNHRVYVLIATLVHDAQTYSGRQHADDEIWFEIQYQRFTDDIRPASEAPLPETIAEYGYGRPMRVRGRKCSADSGLHAQVLLNMQLPGSEPFTAKAIHRIIEVEKAAA
jgi:hypothetical protein